jgi:hypothetical protein
MGPLILRGTLEETGSNSQALQTKRASDELPLSLQDTKGWNSSSHLFPNSKEAAKQVKHHDKNVQELWGFIDDQTGGHELQRVFAMRWSLFIQDCSPRPEVCQLQELYQAQF